MYYFVLILLCTTKVSAQELVIKEKSGSQTAILMGNLQKLSFSSGNIIIKKKDQSSISLALSSVQRLNFQNLTSSFRSEIASKAILSLRPNPVTTNLKISFHSNQNSLVDIGIISMSGSIIICKKNIALEVGENELQLNVSDLSRGIYVCYIRNESSILKKLFIKN